MKAPQFVIFGFPVRVELFFFVTMWLISSGAGDIGIQLAIGAVAGASLLIHELGHAFVFRRFGGGDISIRLMGFGGVTTCRTSGGFSPMQHVAISSAGVISELLFVVLPAFVVLTSMNPSGVLRTVLVYAIWINIIWVVFNILPVLDLDGGHIVQHLAHQVTGRDQTKAVRYLSVGAAAATAFFAYQIGFVFAALFMAFMIYSNIQAIMAMNRGPNVTPPAPRQQPPTTAPYPAEAAPSGYVPPAPPQGYAPQGPPSSRSPFGTPPTGPPIQDVPPHQGPAPQKPPRSYPPIGRQD